MCRKCGNGLSGKIYYQFGKLPVALALALGIGSTWAVTEIVQTNRYPILVEHAIVESCINEPMRPYSKYQVLRKRQICGCALEATQSEFDEKEYGENTREFLRTFEKKAASCRKDG